MAMIRTDSARRALTKRATTGEHVTGYPRVHNSWPSCAPVSGPVARCAAARAGTSVHLGRPVIGHGDGTFYMLAPFLESARHVTCHMYDVMQRRECLRFPSSRLLCAPVRAGKGPIALASLVKVMTRMALTALAMTRPATTRLASVSTMSRRERRNNRPWTREGKLRRSHVRRTCK